MRTIQKQAIAIAICLLCTLIFASEAKAQDTGSYIPYYKAVVSPYRVQDSQDTFRAGLLMCEATRYDPTDSTDYYVRTLLYQNAANDFGEKLKGEIDYKTSADTVFAKAGFDASDKNTYAFGDLNDLYMFSDGGDFALMTVDPPHPEADRLVSAAGHIIFSKAGKKSIVASDGASPVIKVLCEHPSMKRPASTLLLDKDVAFAVREK